MLSNFSRKQQPGTIEPLNSDEPCRKDCLDIPVFKSYENC